MECGNQGAGNGSPCRAAVLHQSAQDRLYAAQIIQLFANIHQFVFGQTSGFLAMSAILQPQQLRNFVQAKAKALQI